MQHRIAGDTIIRGVTTAHRIDSTREIALLMQDIVELQRNSQRFALQETLCYLHIPDQLIGVHRCVVISPTTCLVDIRGDAGAPWRIDIHAATIREMPCIEI